MADVTVRRVEEMERYTGETTGGQFVYAGKSLGVGAWGMNVVDMPPHWDGYPDHDHAADGQEEVYVILSGEAVLHAEGRRWELATGMFARVGPGTRRKIVPGANGARLLALGGTPGKVYERPAWQK